MDDPLSELRQQAAHDMKMKTASGEELMMAFDRLFFEKGDKEAVKKLKVAGELLHRQVKGKWQTPEEDFDKKLQEQIALAVRKIKGSGSERS